MNAAQFRPNGVLGFNAQQTAKGGGSPGRVTRECSQVGRWGGRSEKDWSRGAVKHCKAGGANKKPQIRKFQRRSKVGARGNALRQRVGVAHPRLEEKAGDEKGDEAWH